MTRRSKCKPRMIPQQDKRICGSICFCQLIVVFSSVSLIYLTVAIYIPSYRAFHSGFEERPVMCQTINKSMLNNCSWASCGEWCLTKTSGFCPQMHVTTRQNGTTIQLQNCSYFTSVSCPQVDPNILKRYNCNNGTECSTLQGVFNCSLGHCANLSEIYQCHYKADGHTIDSDKDNMKMNGFFECKGSRCTKINKKFSCDRYCTTISTISKNVFITSDNNLYISKCQKMIATTATNGNQEGYIVEPTTIWKQNSNDVLMMSCHKVKFKINNINATDCINGTIYNATDIPNFAMNFTTFWALSNKWRELVDPKQIFVPMQSVLTIYNISRLYINLDGCVNTLKGECKQFLLTHGNDGRNQTAQSRFTCFYNKNNSFMAISRYDLKKTWQDLLIAVAIPSLLFIVSFITLCIIMQSVKVGDDTKMRCKCCMGSSIDQDLSEMTTTNSKYEISSDGPSKKDETPLVIRT